MRTAEQLTASGNYRIKVAMKCGYGQLALLVPDDIDLSDFFPTGAHRGRQAVVALYRQEHFMGAPLLSDWDYAADEQQRAYRLEGLYSVTSCDRYDMPQTVAQTGDRPPALRAGADSGQGAGVGCRADSAAAARAAGPS